MVQELWAIFANWLKIDSVIIRHTPKVDLFCRSTFCGSCDVYFFSFNVVHFALYAQSKKNVWFSEFLSI